MELEIDFGRCFKMLFRNLWVIICTTLIFCLFGVLITLSPEQNQYTATSTVYSAAAGSYTNSMQGALAMQDYMEIANSIKVCNRAAQIIGDRSITGKMIMQSTSESINEDSYIMNISALSPDPVLAIKMSSALANAFVIEMQAITGGDRIHVLDEAQEAFISYNSASRSRKIQLACTGAGFLLSCAVIVLYTIFNKKLQTVSDCKLNGAIQIIGVIPNNSVKGDKK